MRQCELAKVNRSSIYRKQNKEESDPGHGENQENLDIMKIIDRIHLERPTWGYRKITDYLKHHYGYRINRKRVRRLMRLMDIIALYPDQTSANATTPSMYDHNLLRNMDLDHLIRYGE